MVESLALKYPVPFVARVPGRCLEEAGRTGVMPAPTADELQRTDLLTNHALVLVGYDKAARTVIARNCWGASWGQQGHCTIAFDIISAIAPFGSRRLWVIAKADSVTVAGEAASAAPGASASASPVPPAAAAPETLSDMAARLRTEIRGDVQRDITDATQRIRDMLKKPGPTQTSPQDSCPTCWGRGVCLTCGGKGCTNCGSGSCPRCGGRGTA